MIINTQRFQLKTLTINYVTEEYLSWFSYSKNVNKHIVYAKKNANIEDLRQYVKSRENREDVLFLGIFTNSGRHIGNIKYEPINFKRKIATMGILIGDEEWQGKGVASEVIKASSIYLKESHGIKYIILGVDKTNINAISAYKKIKFEVVEENKSALKMQLDLE